MCVLEEGGNGRMGWRVEEGDGMERVQALEPDALESSVFDLLLYDPRSPSSKP